MYCIPGSNINLSLLFISCTHGVISKHAESQNLSKIQGLNYTEVEAKSCLIHLEPTHSQEGAAHMLNLNPIS